MGAKPTKPKRPDPTFIDQLSAAVGAGEEYALRYSLDDKELDALCMVQINLETLADKFERKLG